MLRIVFVVGSIILLLGGGAAIHRERIQVVEDPTGSRSVFTRTRLLLPWHRIEETPTPQALLGRELLTDVIFTVEDYSCFGLKKHRSESSVGWKPMISECPTFEVLTNR